MDRVTVRPVVHGTTRHAGQFLSEDVITNMIVGNQSIIVVDGEVNPDKDILVRTVLVNFPVVLGEGITFSSIDMVGLVTVLVVEDELRQVGDLMKCFL